MTRKNTLLLSGLLTVFLAAVFAVSSVFYASAASKKQSAKSHKKGVATSEAASSQTSAATKPTQPSREAEAVDLASLSSKKICWGQGRNFDPFNRPQDAVTSQEKYGKLGGLFIGLTEDNDSANKKIYLTFDEGYENGYTAKILDTLKQKKVKAVFFVTGDYAKRECELVKRMIDEGQVVGNHTWRHYSMPEKSLDTCREEISLLHDYVRENYGYEMHVLRPPKGEFSEQTLALASQMGYRTCLWSFAYKDWDANSPGNASECLGKLNERLHPGAVYLLHAVSSTNAAILGDFIDSARAQGYEFITP